MGNDIKNYYQVTKKRPCKGCIPLTCKVTGTRHPCAVYTGTNNTELKKSGLAGHYDSESEDDTYFQTMGAF